ncbi:hypothetical protein C8R43DRAFT_1043599 [Mycena crocata]|nr:hypothetical protein C8R43DRAFT_1043599 [Mycena crocata]
MVLQKRKRDGEFEAWHSASDPASSSPPKPANPAPTASSSRAEVEIPDGPPPSKKPRQGPVHAAKATPKVLNDPPAASSSQKSTPAAKKGRRKAGDPPGVSVEKREAKFKSKCPGNIMERVERVMTQRFFMIDRKRFEGELKEEFQVLGSTGNVYTVTIQHKPSCNCPDAAKGNHCKHILFIYLKVLQVTRTSGYWYQKALLTSELETIFAEAPLAPNALAHPRIREAYARATGKTTGPPSTPTPDVGSKKRLPGKDDDCPICYDEMHTAAPEALTFCEECGNAVHGGCFAQWKQTATTQRKTLTCIYCRAEWPHDLPAAGASGSGSRTTAGGYLNISGVAGVSPQRDTSSYYHGPRRGQRYYGYNAYGEDY